MNQHNQFKLEEQILFIDKRHQDLCIFFHGLGATKEDLVPVYQQLLTLNPSLQSLGALFVQAPIQPCQLFAGQELPCWFDVHSLEDILDNKWVGLTQVVDSLVELISVLQDKYPHIKKISLIGFSQGGVIAQKISERLNVRQLILLSTFAAQPFQRMNAQEIMICHGMLDAVVNIVYGRELEKTCRQFNPDTILSYHEYAFLDHGICQEQLQDMAEFMSS